MVQRRTVASPSLIHLNNLRFFSHVFKSLGIGAIVTDLDGRITHANPTAETLLGWEPGELVGHLVNELTPPGQPPVGLDQVLDAGGTWVGPVHNRRKSGAIIPIKLTTSVIRDDADEPLALVRLLCDDSASRRQRARLSSLVGLGAALNAESDLTALLSRICADARELFSVDGVYLCRLDEKSQELVVLVGEGPCADRVTGKRATLADQDGHLATAVAKRRPVIVHNIDPETERPDLIAQYHSRSSLLVPLIRGERVLGLLVLTDTQRPARFGSEDAELAQAFAELAAVALEGARLHEAERAKSERLLALAHVSRLLTASLERDEVLSAIAEGAQRLLGVDEVYTWLLETPAGPFRLAHYPADNGEIPPLELDYRHCKLGKVVESGQPWQTPDINTTDYVLPYARRRGLHACLMIPLSVQSRPVGGLTIFSRQIRGFEPEDVELAQAFGYQAAIAIQNAQTLDRERQASRLEQLLERARRLHPRDRELVDQLLAAAERIIELDEQSGRSAPRGKRPSRAPENA